MKRIVENSVIFGLLLLLQACTYISNRVNDFHDIFQYGAGVGFGFYMGGRASIFSLGLGGNLSEEWGKVTWEALPERHQGAYFGIPVTFFLEHEDLPLCTLIERRFSASHYQNTSSVDDPGKDAHFEQSWKNRSITTNNVFFTSTIFSTDMKDSSRYRMLLSSIGSFEFNLFLGSAGVRGGVNMTEFFDFLFGFTTLDFMGDDNRYGKEGVRINGKANN